MTSEKQVFNFYIGNERTIEDIESDNKLFTGEISFIKGIKSFQDIPKGDFIEICFSGRSNVGKSSLINFLTGRKSIARTSKTPLTNLRILISKVPPHKS